MINPVLLLLAAGSSRRMRGGDKLLETIDGLPLLRRQAMCGIDAGLDVLVTLPPNRLARSAVLDGLPVTPLEVRDAAEGMGASIRAGAAALDEPLPSVILMPADMPEIDACALKAIAKAHTAHPDRVLRGATADGRLGHPVVFPSRCVPALRALTGDVGARAVLIDEDILPVPLPGQAALTDLDTPEAWAAWRAQQG